MSLSFNPCLENCDTFDEKLYNDNAIKSVLSFRFNFSLKNGDEKTVAQIFFGIGTNQLFRKFVFFLRFSATFPLGHALVHLPLFVDGRIAHYVGNHLKEKKFIKTR